MVEARLGDIGAVFNATSYFCLLFSDMIDATFCWSDGAQHDVEPIETR